MIEIKVNDEVRDVEAQVWLGLTVRQVVLLATGLFIGVFVGLFLYRKTPIDLFFIGYASIITVTPFVLMAFIKWHELTPFAVVKLWLTKLIEPTHKEFYEPNEEYIALTSKQDKPKKIRKRKTNEK